MQIPSLLEPNLVAATLTELVRFGAWFLAMPVLSMLSLVFAGLVNIEQLPALLRRPNSAFDYDAGSETCVLAAT